MNEHNDNALAVGLKDHEARVNITYGGKNGDLPDPVMFQSGDGDVKTWVTEAVRAGSVPGLDAHAAPDLADFVVDRFAATEARPYNLIQVRPKTPFGFACGHCANAGCGIQQFFRGACCECGKYPVKTPQI